MRLTYVAVAALQICVLVNLHAATSQVSTGVAVMTWIAGVALLVAHALVTVRTVHRLPLAPIEDSRRGIFLIVLTGLALASLALSLAARR